MPQEKSKAAQSGVQPDESDDENKFEALFDSQKRNDRSGKFSLTRYSAYTRQQRLRKLTIQRSFKTVVSKLMNK